MSNPGFLEDRLVNRDFLQSSICPKSFFMPLGKPTRKYILEPSEDALFNIDDIFSDRFAIMVLFDVYGFSSPNMVGILETQDDVFALDLVLVPLPVQYLFYKFPLFAKIHCRLDTINVPKSHLSSDVHIFVWQSPYSFSTVTPISRMLAIISSILV